MPKQSSSDARSRNTRSRAVRIAVIVVLVVAVVTLLVVNLVKLVRDHASTFPAAAENSTDLNDVGEAEPRKLSGYEDEPIVYMDGSGDDDDNAEVIDRENTYSLENFLLQLDEEKLCNDRGLVEYISSTSGGENPAWKDFLELCSSNQPLFPPVAPFGRGNVPRKPGTGSMAFNKLSGRELALLNQDANRTACKPRDTLVKVADELELISTTEGTSKAPCKGGSFYEHKIYPPCVAVKRCSGCCDAPLTCTPVGDNKRTVKLIWEFHDCGKSVYESQLRNVTVIEHKQCKCSCVNRADKCQENQFFDEKTCACICPKASRKKCPRSQKWDGAKCACVCRQVKQCASGREWNDASCTCKPSSTPIASIR